MRVGERMEGLFSDYSNSAVSIELEEAAEMA